MTDLSDCGWGQERCAEMAEESSWLIWLLTTDWALFGFVFLVVLWLLPASAWHLIVDEYRRHQPRSR